MVAMGMFSPYGFRALENQNAADTQAANVAPAMPGYTGLDGKSFAEMRTPEDQIHWLYLHALNLAKTKAEKDAVEAEFAKVWEQFNAFKEHGFDDYYAEQIAAWVKANAEGVIKDMLGIGVYFGLTSDGYFCAYSPATWSDVQFDTGAIYGTEEYGRLILRYLVNGQGVIDNTRYDASVMSDTIDSRFKSAAGNGLEYVNDKLNVKVADDITFGGVKLTHDVNNDTDDEHAVTSDGVYKYAPSKAETTRQPTEGVFTDVLQGVTLTLQDTVRIGGVVCIGLRIQTSADTTVSAATRIAKTPAWIKGVATAVNTTGANVMQIDAIGISCAKSIEPNSDLYFWATCHYNG